METLKVLEANSVDSVVTDPPYGLSFMNKKWDYEVPSIDFWKEVYRVLKPGGHILSFGGTRTYHRMVVNIEDAGFEIRDQIQWIYSTGFPKSLNIKKQIEKKEYERYECKKRLHTSQTQSEHDLRQLPETNISQTINPKSEQGQTLLSQLSEQDIQISEHTTGDVWREKSCLEGRGDAVQEKGQLQGHYLQKSTNTSITNGEKGWIYNGAQDHNGGENREIIDENRSSSSYRPQPIKQQSKQSGALAEQLLTQESGVEPVCSRCEKPFIEWEGWGTALKPANEPIVLARKPLSEKSIAENVMRWRTGGLNIDGCRIGTDDKLQKLVHQEGCNRVLFDMTRRENGKKIEFIDAGQGRFPANVILECCCDEVIKGESHFKMRNKLNGDDICKDAVGYKIGEGVPNYDYNDKGDIHTNTDCPCYIMDEQSGVSKSSKMKTGDRESFLNSNNVFEIKNDGKTKRIENFGDSGGASRFFYRAKVSKKERNLGLDDKNNHPTVKPINLLTYLCRLITPERGIILDPFMGSGSTGVAALLEGFDFIGIELEKDYYNIAKRRIEKYEEYKKIIK